MTDVRVSQKVMNQANEQKECSTKEKPKNINDSLNHGPNDVEESLKNDH